MEKKKQEVLPTFSCNLILIHDHFPWDGLPLIVGTDSLNFAIFDLQEIEIMRPTIC